MKINVKSNINNFRFVSFAFLMLSILLTALNVKINGQGMAPFSRTPGAPTGSYGLSNFEDINLFNGNLNINLPIHNVTGRGEVSQELSLTLDTQWDANSTLYENGAIGIEAYPLTQMPLNLVSSVTATSNIPVTLNYEEPCGSGPSYWVEHQFNFKLVEPNGTEHMLVDPTSHGMVMRHCGTSTKYYGRNFESVTGEFITFVTDSDVWSHSYSVTGYLYFTNGTKSRVENGKILWTRDRNGNQTEYTYDSSYYPRPTKVKDSLGREVNIEYNVTESAPYGVCDRLIFKGVGGAERIIRISRGSLANLLRTTQSTDPSSIPNVGVLFNDNPNDDWYLNASQTFSEAGPGVKAVWLPDGRNYQFQYSVYGKIARVILPTGGAIEYDYEAPQIGRTGWNGPAHIVQMLIEKRMYDENNELLGKSTFSRVSGGETTVDVQEFDSANNRLTKVRHYFRGFAQGEFPYNVRWNRGKEYKTEYFDANGSDVLRRVETDWRQRTPTWCLVNWPGNSDPELCPLNNPFVIETKTTLVEANLVSTVSSVNPAIGGAGGWSFDNYNNPTDVWYYDYGSGQPGAFIKREHTDYVTSSGYLNIGLARLPSQKWISSDSAGANKVSLQQYEYDTYSGSNHAALEPRSNVTGFDSTNYSSANTIRGNVTSLTSYANAANQTGGITVYFQYDVLGNTIKTIDGNTNTTTVSYNDNFGTPDGNATTNSTPSQISGLSTFAFPTSTTNPLGWTLYMQRDYFTGNTVNTQDINGVISKAIYNDTLDRPTQTVTAIGTNLEIQSTTTYDDSNRRVQVTTDLNTLNDNLLKNESLYDGFARTIEERKYEADGDYVATKIKYDFLGRPYKKSNPFRPTEIDVSHPIIWTTSFFDALGRLKEIETPDCAGVSNCGKIKNNYDGNRTLITDQAGKQRIKKVDSLGRTTDVWEITGQDSATVSVSFPNQSLSAGYLTSYVYDKFDNLTTVNQGSQTRSFTYDSLSRLVSATIPETGTINYEYDANGNLTLRNHLRSGTNKIVNTGFTYDALNRLLGRSYATPNGTPDNYQATPTVTYTYDDANISNSKGKLTKVNSSVSTMEYVTFDILGRVTRSKQTTNGVVYGDDTNPMTYTYNLSGALVEQKYPSGRVIKYTLDNGEDLSQVQSKKNQSSGYWTYANSFTYNPAGRITSMQLGNGRWESTIFNSRFQPTQIALGVTPGATNLLDIDYSYGVWTGSDVDGTKNNANVARQVINVQAVGSNPGFSATQIYTYDALNRIGQATEYISGVNWQQTFTYDRYGNRNYVEAGTTTLVKACTESGNPVVCAADRKKFNPSINGANNRLNTSDGYGYDMAGNTTSDANSQQYTYDGEDRMVQVGNGSGTLGYYYYDGDGKRVKKVVPGTDEITIFVYDASGKMIGEYSTKLNPTPQVSYLTNDNLGSPRINTNENGAVISRHDYYPYGEEITGGVRIAALGYQPDNNRKQFTGYERDQESGLDFAQARMYNKDHGRFTSPDPLLSTQRMENPQTFNRYVYTLNNPLRYVDPTGLYEFSEELGGSLTDDELRNEVRMGKRKQADVDEIIRKREQFRAAFDELKRLANNPFLSPDERALLTASYMSYGTFKDKNGVVIHFDNGEGGQTIGYKPGTILVFLQDKAGKVNDLLNVAHEGSHVKDWHAFNIKYDRGEQPTGPTLYETERDAYKISEIIGKYTSGVGGYPTPNGTYWLTALTPDQQRIQALRREDHIKNAYKVSSASGQGGPTYGGRRVEYIHNTTPCCIIW